MSTTVTEDPGDLTGDVPADLPDDPSGDAVGEERDRQLQGRLNVAAAAVREAYRDTTRLIRLLSVLGQPAAPEELMEQTLAVLSEVFFAEITMVAHLLGNRLVVTGFCGVPEDDPVLRDGWPVAGVAAEALRTGAVVTRHGRLHAVDLPGPAARLRFRSAAWIPLSGGVDADDLLILLRRSEAPFTNSDVHVLSSVAWRLQLAVEERERGAVIEQLARYSHLLTSHLEPEPLLDEAVGLLRRLTDADQAWVTTVDGDRTHLRAHQGLSEKDVAGWPRPVEAVEGRPVVRVLHYQAGSTDSTSGVPGTVLQVPVVRDGALVAVLFAARLRPRPFAKDVPEIAAIFANYLAVAMINSELYQALRLRATHDPLTGLANRVLVAARLEQALSPAAATPVGLLFCDLDRFKVVNDLLGHDAGDELLQQVAERLRGSVRPTDLLARFGGDEFVVVLAEVRNLSEVAEVGRRVARDLEDEFALRDERVRVSASIGGVLGVPGAGTPSAMLRDADAAMYTAKERGVGQVEVFDDAASHRALDRLDLRSELPRALERGQLHLHYQPIVALDSGRIVAFEALLRWHHPRHGAVPPDVFIPLAEDTGTTTTIGRWVLEQACRQLASWRRLPGGRIAVSVNLFGAQLRRADAAAEILATIRGAGLEPGDVWLEVTEHSYLRHDVSRCASALRDAGVHFALDDFGTAYSSLSHLQRIPIELLKIDESFVDGVTDQDRDRSIVRAILGIASSLGLTTVGEGIETEAQRAALLALGCQLGQGHLVSPPVPPAEATRLMDASGPEPARP